MLDPRATDHADLRSGLAPWQPAQPRRPVKLAQSTRCDVAIVGAGITGALAAEHLSKLGRQVCVIDRERPGFGSTAASTSMLMWEIDRPLSELAELYGFERAANVYRRSVSAVGGLLALMHDLGLDAGQRRRNSLYLASADTTARELQEECALRRRAGLPSTFLDQAKLQGEFHLRRDAAILSTGAADADPLRLSHALTAIAVERGAMLIDAEAIGFHPEGHAVAIELEDGLVVEAGHVVLATGYAMPALVKADSHRITSSFALATRPQQIGQLWRDGVLMWEASSRYLYARTTIDNRIIVGGEDDDQAIEPEQRERMMPAKTQSLAAKLKDLWPEADATPEFVWSGAFGTTSDGLPLIGRVPGEAHIIAAYGYGGNGITFSYLASRMIGLMISGDRRDWFDDFALDRERP